MKTSSFAIIASVIALSAANLAPSIAHAEDALATPKVTISLRSGYALALGDASRNNKLSDGVEGQIPIWLDASYRVIPNLSIGGYFQYGIGILNGDIRKQCEATNVSCSASDIRFGAFVRGHFDTQSLRPYVGLGLGYEILGLSRASNGATADASFKGVEFLNLHGGLDFKVSHAIGIGPFLSYSLGQYSTGTLAASDGNGDTVSVTGDIPEKSIHTWLLIGLGGSFSM